LELQLALEETPHRVVPKWEEFDATPGVFVRVANTRLTAAHFVRVANNRLTGA
jgi:hypothetical protein